MKEDFFASQQRKQKFSANHRYHDIHQQTTKMNENNDNQTISLTKNLDCEKSVDQLLDQLVKPKNHQETDDFYSIWASNYEKVRLIFIKKNIIACSLKYQRSPSFPSIRPYFDVVFFQTTK